MSKKIVIIDDEPTVTKMLVYRLEAKGYEITTAIDGKEGVALIRSQKPDLIILDYLLPDMTSKEVADNIKKDDELSRIPIILITASVEDIDEKAKECSAVDFMAKPIEPETLYQKVEKQIGS